MCRPGRGGGVHIPRRARFTAWWIVASGDALPRELEARPDRGLHDGTSRGATVQLASCRRPPLSSSFDLPPTLRQERGEVKRPFKHSGGRSRPRIASFSTEPWSVRAMQEDAVTTTENPAHPSPGAPRPPERANPDDLHARPRQRRDGRAEPRRLSVNPLVARGRGPDCWIGRHPGLLWHGWPLPTRARDVGWTQGRSSPAEISGCVDRLRAEASFPRSPYLHPAVTPRRRQPNHATLTCERREAKLLLQRSIRRGPKGERSRD